MEIKRLKEVWIASYKFKIEWDKNSYDSSFSFEECKMSIGIKSGLENETFSNLLHEISEAYFEAFCLRLSVPNGEYLFNFSHKEFNIINMMIAKTILEFFK